MEASPHTTFLFTDLEGSTRLWESEPERMRAALARHDESARAAVAAHRGELVKMTGDGLHAAFEDPLDAILATVSLQVEMLEAEGLFGVPLRLRCGLHAGSAERRDNDYYGTAVNRAARIMSAAHGGQVLVSGAVASRLADRLPADLRLRDLGEVRLRDLADPERLFQLIHPRLRSEFPPLRALGETPNNLPHHLSSFVGRERELSAVRELLAANRLATVVGMGGMGKTRLALQAAAELTEGFRDGVWLVELAALRDAERVVQAVASTLGVVEGAGRPLLDALARHLKPRKALILLDNCEHLREASAAVARALLEAAPGVRILATSREPLQLAGEAILLLSSLAVPSPLAAAEVAALRQYASVQLFVERAAAASPRFSLDAGTAPAVSAICHRLDGIPLALELAAARVRTLPVHQIAEGLKARLRTLSSRDPTAHPRQRTLEALVDWSHELLAEDERRLLRHLAVFSGGWTVEAAEGVCSAAGPEHATVLEPLSRLVEKSLVAMEGAGERYRLLETVHHYARARLEASGEGPELARRHFAFYRDLARQARAALVGPEQSRWLAILDAERENILAAHAAVDAGAADAAAGLELASLMKLYWINRGLPRLGERVTREALGRPGAQARDEARCRALFDAGQLRYFMGDYESARPLLAESLAIARELRDDAKVAAVLQPLGMTTLGLGERETAAALLREALAFAEKLENHRGIATACTALGQCRRLEGRMDEAAALFERTAALSRESGDREMLAVGLLNLAMAAIERGLCDESPPRIAEAIDIAEELRSRPMLKSALDACAGLASAGGRHAAAARFFGAAESQAEKAGLGRDPADSAFLEGRMRRSAAALGDAGFDSAAAGGREIPYGEAVREAREWLASLTGRPAIPCR